MAKHSLLSSSKTEQWTKCPGAIVYLEDNLGLEKPGGLEAKKGTCAHKLIEICLSGSHAPKNFKNQSIRIINKDTDDEKAVLYKGNESGIDFIIDDDMIEATTHFIDYVYARIKEFGLNEKDIHIEYKVNPLPTRDDTFGTADIILDVWPIFIEVIDYKHGEQVFVDVKNNLQLKSYGLGALYGKDGVLDRNYENVICTICQPRHRKSSANGLSSEVIPLKEMLEYKDWLLGEAEKVDKAKQLTTMKLYNNTNLNNLYGRGFISSSGYASHCTYCCLNIICPSLIHKMEELSRTDFEKIKYLGLELKTTVNINDESKYLAEILPWLPKITKWVKDIKAKAREIMLNGEKIEGYKVVVGRSSRKWAFDSDAHIVEVLGKLYDVPSTSLLKLISGPQAEKLIPKDERKNFNTNFLYKSEGGMVIAKNSDRRKQIDIQNVKDDFDVIKN